MNNALKEIKISKLERRGFSILGWILAFTPPFLWFWLFYTVFFERKLYKNRKNLYEWLRTNSLPEPDEGSICWIFNICDFRLYYWKNHDTVSLHHKDDRVIVCSFTGDPINRRYDAKIRKIVFDKIEEIKNKRKNV